MKAKKNAVVVSGYFNPLHKGHIEYLTISKSFASQLFVIVNNDFQRELKGSAEFQSESERLLIIQNLRVVDKCFLSIDRDRSVVNTLEDIYLKYSSDFNLIFANGGDQNNNSIPERDLCIKLGIELLDGIGEKIQSSSWLLNKI